MLRPFAARDTALRSLFLHDTLTLCVFSHLTRVPARSEFAGPPACLHPHTKAQCTTIAAEVPSTARGAASERRCACALEPRCALGGGLLGLYEPQHLVQEPEAPVGLSGASALAWLERPPWAAAP